MYHFILISLLVVLISFMREIVHYLKSLLSSRELKMQLEQNELKNEMDRLVLQLNSCILKNEEKMEKEIFEYIKDVEYKMVEMEEKINDQKAEMEEKMDVFIAQNDGKINDFIIQNDNENHEKLVMVKQLQNRVNVLYEKVFL